MSDRYAQNRAAMALVYPSVVVEAYDPMAINRSLRAAGFTPPEDLMTTCTPDARNAWLAAEPKCKQIDAKVNALLLRDIQFTPANGFQTMFQADFESQRLIDNASRNWASLNERCLASGLEGASWNSAYNTLIPMTQADLEGLYAAIFQRTADLKLAGMAAKAYLRAGAPLPAPIQALLALDAQGNPL